MNHNYQQYNSPRITGRATPMTIRMKVIGKANDSKTERKTVQFAYFRVMVAFVSNNFDLHIKH